MISETIKQANTERPIHDLIRSRWSARSFSEKAIAQADVETILEAASWAFSANNSQPWHYLYAHHADTDAFQKLWSCLMPGNQPWCANAAVLLVSCIHKVNESGRPTTGPCTTSAPPTPRSCSKQRLWASTATRWRVLIKQKPLKR